MGGNYVYLLILENLPASGRFFSFSQDESQLIFLLGGATPNLCWGRKGGTPARSWLGIVRATGPDPFRHCSRPNTHLHYMPLCEATPAGFAN